MEIHSDTYEFRIEGHLGASWASWFDGLSIRHLDTGDTLLRGPLEDQAALHGILIKIRDLGLQLISVTRVNAPGGRPMTHPMGEETHDESR